MLNLSTQNKITEDLNRYSTVAWLTTRSHYKFLNRIIAMLGIMALVAMFLPWTQNVGGSGSVTALKPDQRPQAIQSAIAGRIEKWYVGEGDFVRKGDTILFLSEIKEDYLDPDLVNNTKSQVDAKTSAVSSYQGKVAALDRQLQAIETEKKLKLQQARIKLKQAALGVKSDSIDFEATRTHLKIAQIQYDRAVKLQTEGLKPLTDVEEKRLELQEVQAKIITAENKLLTSRTDLVNAKVEIGRIEAEYFEKNAKAQSDQYTAMSSRYESEAQVKKLQNQYASYKIRNGMYYITAPQDGYVNRAIQTGIGETIKEGTSLVSIMPAKYDVAVESFVSARDLPLMRKGAKVRVWFDGWPSIVFSGWPGMSYGTFGGRIVAIENFISDNGKFRILIAPDPDQKNWPKQISIGSGAQTLALLDNVPVWFELWRSLNGFPPNYYQGDNDKKDQK